MRILVVEDDPELAAFIAAGLDRAGHAVVLAGSGEEADGLADARDFDAVILDRMLPGMTGLDLLRQWRGQGRRTPVLLLTALDGIDDRVEGLDAGADDHVGKPFAINELLARLHAIVRRTQAPEAAARIEQGGLVLDLLRRQLRYKGRLVALQPREMRLLEELMRQSGEAVTRAMLLERVWGFTFDPQTSIVETHMSRLRTKLADSGVPVAIEAVRNVGYRLVLHE
ncbi:DNA-binding response regulator [Sphingobium sp. LB126]|uniref:XRE family transcriptional regulator n=1 Tax=Sphingobium chungbukense TaxID=56193 RepID=A0A0M3AZX5_9SPHN|nr:XRE family transcriptional regulator [Sphingobium chungbukense]PJG49793.1 DNA-binding response regulator [Sphingobium sp. LB126]